MKSILEIYSTLWEATKNEDRFIGETFVDLVYKNVSPQLTVVDLGAFTGEFSFFCLPFAKQIYAVEPDPVPFEKLKQYHEQFQLGERMKIFNYAIAGEDGPRHMHLSHAGGSNMGGTEDANVQAYSFDTFMKENKITHIDILKVDIEGSEKELFNSEKFKSYIPLIDKIIGEHDGFLDLGKYGYHVESLPAGVYLATK